MVRPVVEAAGLELVEIAFTRQSGRRILRVLVDRDREEGGLDLDSISEVSERISRRLDLEGYDPPGGRYTLEVSSPGVERPLKAPKDFERRVGQKLKVRTITAAEGSRTIAGTIVSVGPDGVRIATDAELRAVRFEDIAWARTVFEWGAAEKPGKRKGARRAKR